MKYEGAKVTIMTRNQRLRDLFLDIEQTLEFDVRVNLEFAGYAFEDDLDESAFGNLSAYLAEKGRLSQAERAYLGAKVEGDLESLKPIDELTTALWDIIKGAFTSLLHTEKVEGLPHDTPEAITDAVQPKKEAP
jgi:hypothetical protein